MIDGRDSKGKFIKGHDSDKLHSWRRKKRCPNCERMIQVRSRICRWCKTDTLETRAKKSVTKLGKNNPMFGRLGKESPRWNGGVKRGFLHSRIRRSRRLKNGGSHTNGDWELLKARCNWTCLCCGLREPIIRLSKDHIVPVVNGGSDNIENIQPLCRRCNAKKHIQSINYLNRR